MSKPAKAGYKLAAPFVNTERLKITAREEGGKIISFEAVVDGEKKIALVKNNRVLDAFKEIEKFTKHL